MVERSIRNEYQLGLAEQSLVIDAAENGEVWSFRWYVDPISNGLAKWYQFQVYVHEDGIQMLGISPPRDEEEFFAQEQAARFVRERYERIGLDEPDQESGN